MAGALAVVLGIQNHSYGYDQGHQFKEEKN
jgi:hypothetical protein